MIKVMNRIQQFFSRSSDARRTQTIIVSSAEPVTSELTMPMTTIHADNLTVPTQPINADAMPDAEDTQPGRAVERGAKLSSDETDPRRPAELRTEPDVTGLPEPSDAPMPIFGTPGDPYAGLFPPPAPDDDDYLESSFPPPDDPTPTDFPDVGRNSPHPPDSLPL